MKIPKRITHWLTYNVLVASFPLIIKFILRLITGTLTPETIVSPDALLFMALILSARALADLTEITDDPSGYLRLFRSGLKVGLVWSAIFYGVIVYDEIIGQNLEFIYVLIISLITALPALLVTTLIEFWVADQE